MLNIVKLPEGTFPYIPVTSLVQKPPLAGLGLVQEGMAQGTLGAEALFRVDLQQTSEGRAEKFSPSFHRWELPPGGPQNRLIVGKTMPWFTTPHQINTKHHFFYWWCLKKKHPRY